MERSTLFVSGSNGFIGKNFLTQSNAQYAIQAPTRAEIELTDSDAVDHWFQGKEFTAIIHAASTAVSRTTTIDPLKGFHDNIRAFANLLRQEQVCARFIQLGSGAEYARPLATRQIHEDQLSKQLPLDDYGFAKWCCSQMLNGLSPGKAINLRLFGVFGPFEDYQVRFISNAIVRALFGLPIIIRRNVEFDYVYINDVIRIIHRFIEQPAQHTHYNITTGQPLLLSDLAEIVRNVIGCNVDIIIENKILAPAYTGSNQRLRKFLGDDFNFTPISSAINELATWYEARRTHLNYERIANPL